MATKTRNIKNSISFNGLFEKHFKVMHFKLDRLESMDLAKGIAIIAILLVHLGSWWNDGTWFDIWQSYYLILDWLGPTIFITFSVIGTMISIRYKQVTGKTRGMFKNALLKFIYFFVVGQIMNFVIDFNNEYKVGPYMFLQTGNVIIAVAFTQLLSYGLIKLKTRHLFLILISLMISYGMALGLILNGIKYDDSGAINVGINDLNNVYLSLYYFLFNMDAMIPAYSWLISATLTAFTFRWFIDFYMKSSIISFVKPSLKKVLKSWEVYMAKKMVLSGLLIVFITLSFGGLLVVKGIGFGYGAYHNLMNSSLFQGLELNGLPLIFQRHNPFYLSYNMGIFMIFFGILFYIIKCKGKKFIFQDWVVNFGRYTFTIFVYTHALALLPTRFSFIGYMIIYFPVTALLVFLVKMWNDRLKGIFSLEWGLQKYWAFVNFVKTRKKRH
ncbi:MAG: hypothetical protein ACTSVI_12270 [Promethearchaeota archaeon]